MKKMTVVISLLVGALVVSNAWLATKVLDGGISYTYLKASNDTANELVLQTTAVLNTAISRSPSKAEIVAVAKMAAPGVSPYEKLGYTWVGNLGMKFNEGGRLVEVITSEGDAK